MSTFLRAGTLGSIFAFSAISAAIPSHATAAPLISSTAYEQNFDGLTDGTNKQLGSAASSTDGWFISTASSYSPITAYSSTQYSNPSFAAQSTSLKPYACSNGSDIAFGARQATGYGYVIGVFLRNASGAPITKVEISSTLDLWRVPSADPSSATGGLQSGINAASMGDAASASYPSSFLRISGGTTYRPRRTDSLHTTYSASATLDGLNWQNNDVLVLGWYFPSSFAPSGMTTTPVMALDDVRITFTGTGVPEPGSIMLGIGVTCAALALRPLRRRVITADIR